MKIVPVSKFRGKPKLPKSAGASKIISARNVQIMERRYQVVTLRKQGYTTKEIADTLRTSVETVRADVVALLRQTISETAETTEENRQLQIERLDGLLKKYYPLAEAGSLAAAAMVLSVEARRSKLLALDLPEVKKLDVTGIREYVGISIEDV